MTRSTGEWVQDILAAIGDTRVDTLDMGFTAFASKPTIVRSTLYSIAVMGETAKNISLDFKAAYLDIPWRAIAGIRGRIVHEYFRTNTPRIWDVMINNLDNMGNALRLPPLGPPATD